MALRQQIALPGAQSGAALVIGLILLLVLTILAISGISSASMEFFMAGNEQFHQNAFQAAETGIEQSIVTGNFNPGSAAQTITGNNTASDAFASTITPQLGGVAQPAPPGYSLKSISTYHFDIQSVGTATRGARAQNNQGIAVFVKSDDTKGPGGNLPSTQLN